VLSRHARLIAIWIIGFAISILGPCVASASPDVGQIAPRVVVRTLDGALLDLDTLRSHVVVLNFWASWCVPCRAEMPLLEEFYQKHQADGVLVIGLSVDDRADWRELEKAARRVTYPVALLESADANGFGSPKILPLTYVIDKNGAIRARLLPTRAAFTEQALALIVLPLLAGPPVSAPP